MRYCRAGYILALFLSASAAGGCGGSKIANNSVPSNRVSNAIETDSARTNVEELGMYLRVPYETEDIVWKEIASQRKLIAVLRFSPVDSAKVVTEAEKVGTASMVTIESESWFPDELVAQSDLSGDDTLRGQSYAADAFLQPPYNYGRITRIEGTDYFVLEATAK
ncbi:MAG: hypothetical protein KA746_05900 [Pyrinomonadaceae bacterium]|nr:hypothetical protein [Pyrinomonadaceae bacterium]MBP6214033.1 hypothetical protein [Pyrinomonadaceae bacterium]